MPEQARRILHLIDDYGRRMTTKKILRLLLSLRSFSRQIERDKLMAWKKSSQRGCFTGLAGAGKYDHWTSARSTLQPPLD
jgi:hypothetical protein